MRIGGTATRAAKALATLRARGSGAIGRRLESCIRVATGALVSGIAGPSA